MSFPVAEVATGITVGAGVLAAWLDLRKRTNGDGPLGTKLSVLETKVEDSTGHLKELRGYFIDHLKDHNK